MAQPKKVSRYFVDWLKLREDPEQKAEIARQWALREAALAAASAAMLAQYPH